MFFLGNFFIIYIHTRTQVVVVVDLHQIFFFFFFSELTPNLFIYGVVILSSQLIQIEFIRPELPLSNMPQDPTSLGFTRSVWPTPKQLYVRK
jgi:hypothetical protein